MKSLERGMDAPKRKTSETKQEVEWVYTMSLPHEKGEPNIQIAIGVPQEHKTSMTLLPYLSKEAATNYHIEVPLNVIIGDQKIECVAKGTVRGDLGNNKFSLDNIESRQENLPESTINAIKAQLDPSKNKTVRDKLEQEIEIQCRNYFNKQRREEK